MTNAYDTLLERVHTVHDLAAAAAVLYWDREVNMPKAGNVVRTHQLTSLRRLVHELSTSDEMGALIESAAATVAGADYDSDEASLVRELQRSFADARKLPAEFVARSTAVSGDAHRVWVEARQDNDFTAFEPWLARIVELCREMADLYGYDDEPYDALLDKYERGARTADVRAILDAARVDVAPLVAAIAERGDLVDDSLLHQPFDVADQERFVRQLVSEVGYDLDRGHLGTAVHPFATAFGRDDVRITTRWYPDFLGAALFGGLHESGHALYEQGTAPELARTPLARGTSMGIHESQSRMIENLVGRSRGFWEAHFPSLQATFRSQLGGATAEDFYRAVNRVSPSLIRVEADELTYNLHIILRFELERAMLSGQLAARDLPTAWNDRMRDLLGIVPQTDREGCLQDVHWTSPSFGYFPTYALGNLYAAQFLEAALDQDPAVRDELARGRTDALLAWLREHIHRHGKKLLPHEVVTRATGRPLDHAAYVRYVKNKYSDLYGL